MSNEGGPPIRRPNRIRKTASERLLEALIALAGGHASILDHEEEPWASITFTGARHNVRLTFEGTKAIEAGETFIAALPDHEFKIPGHLIGSATVTAVDHTLRPRPRLVLGCELLLLVDT